MVQKESAYKDVYNAVFFSKTFTTKIFRTFLSSCKIYAVVY